MPRLILITWLSFVVILTEAVPFIAGASDVRPVPPGEATYEESYVPCGYEDTKRRVPIVGAEGEWAGRYTLEPASYVDKAGNTIQGDGIVDNPCEFKHIIIIAKKIIMGWIIFGVTAATMAFAYAGYLYITAMGSEEKISHAHSIFTKTVWGFVFMLSAFLIVFALENIFLTDEALERSLLEQRSDL